MKHCWQDYHEWLEKNGEDHLKDHEARGTCMREAGHSGDHVWTLDDDILVEFKNVRS